MTLFLDTSVILAACGSGAGASREVFRLAPINQWKLLASPYVVEEVVRNLPQLHSSATPEWQTLRRNLELTGDVLTLEWPAVFPVPKDRPILFTALAWADVLLTRDRHDFGRVIGSEFYGLGVLTPGDFLARQRAAGELRHS
jgi:predicted nucleic acid-binding protein